MEQNITILLTASIAPKNVPFLMRTNAQKRELEYLNAVQFYLKNTFYKIVFIENTGYNIDKFKQLNTDNRIEFFQFNATEKTSIYGKGYGEMLILNHGIENSNFLNKSKWIVKISGRLILKNIKFIVKNNIKKEKIDIFSDLKGFLFYSDSRCFMAKKDFYEFYLIKLITEINDIKGRDFEQVLAKAILQYIIDGNKWHPLAATPIFKGYSGTNNMKYPTSLLYYIKSLVKRKLLINLFKNY